MELHLPAHHWEHRMPDWAAAAVAGVAGGAVLMVLDLLWSALVTGESPWRTSYLIAAIVSGPDALGMPADFHLGVVSTALITHYLLGLGFGLLLGFSVAGFHWDADPIVMAEIGVLFGLLLYLFDFHVMTQAFPWFVEMRGWATLAAHLVFGVVTAMLYWKLAARGMDRPWKPS